MENAQLADCEKVFLVPSWDLLGMHLFIYLKCSNYVYNILTGDGQSDFRRNFHQQLYFIKKKNFLQN